MLLTKEVEISYIKKTHKHYENLGYIFPKIEKKKPILRNRNGKLVRDYQKEIKYLPILVKVEDLSIGSSIEVQCECDHCGKVTTMKYCTYLRINKNGKTYCRKCGNFLFHSGENNWKWNPKRTEEERKYSRSTSEYLYFVNNVMARDNYICQCCESKDNIQVHHLDSYDWCIEKRFEVTNGITLCECCHKNFHSIYGYGNNTRIQFEEWFNKTIKDLSINENKLYTCKVAYCNETKEIIYNITDYCRKNHLDSSCIYDCCNHKSLSYKNKHYFWLKELDEDIENNSIKLSKEIEEQRKQIMSQQRKQSGIVRRKGVVQLTTNGDFVKEYKSLSEVKENGYNGGVVSSCCNKMKNYKTHKGYIWVFAEEYYKI